MPTEEHEFTNDDSTELATVLRFPSNTHRPERDTTAPLRVVVGEVLRDERHAQQRTLAEVAGDAIDEFFLCGGAVDVTHNSGTLR